MATNALIAALTTLEKLKILVETEPNVYDQVLTALYNPNEITIEKTVNWSKPPVYERDTSPIGFSQGANAILRMDLFFDTWEMGTDVRTYTDQVAGLALVQSALHRPPVCRLVWGQASQFFQGILQSVIQRFTHFQADGTPVRARLSCTFIEWRSAAEEGLLKKLQSTDVTKSYTVRRGDTLSGIAATVYHDPSLWRPIAAANNLVNPRILSPGQVLAIPALRPGHSGNS